MVRCFDKLSTTNRIKDLPFVLGLSKDIHVMTGFDKLSPNGTITDGRYTDL